MIESEIIIEQLTEWMENYFREHKIYYRSRPVNSKFPVGYARTFEIIKIEKRKEKENEKI